MAEFSQYVRSALNGDQSAYEQLYSATCHSVYFTCLGFTKNEEDARDVMQSVYITAFEKLNTLSEPEKFGAWVNRIAVNKCKDLLAKRNTHPEISIDDEENFTDIADETAFSEEYIENAEKRRIIMEIIRGSLSDVLYQTVIMFYFDEMSIAEIAESMGCPEGTVKYRLNSARAKIKKGVLDYEKKNDERLHAIAGLPFLTRLFDAAAKSAELPQLHIGSIMPQKISFPGGAAEANAPTGVSQGIANGGKAMLNSLKSKLIAGICAVAIAGGGVAAGVIIANNANNTSYAKNSSDTQTSKPAVTVTSSAASVVSKPQSVAAIDVSVPQASEPEREIKTSAATKEEVIALFLKAFREKDTEVLSAFRCGNYDKMFNALCKALDEAGNLPNDIDEIDLDPKLFEVYRVTYSVIEDTWEATYSLADGNFTFSFKFSDYDYTNKAYSIKSIELLDHTVLRYYLSAYREYAASGEMLQGGSYIEAVDITPYLD